MLFTQPLALWLLPLAAAPIIIHLLSRLRYHRVRWAAIDFLLSVERRTVRRAKLQQLILLILRTLVILCAVLALSQPVLRAGAASFLGARPNVVILLDASASMSASSAAGSAFERAQKIAGRALQGFPQGARAMAIACAGRLESPFAEPLQDVALVEDFVTTARITHTAGNIPAALRAAGQALSRSGGGSVWLITDGQETDWRVDAAGDWETARNALKQAGVRSVIVTVVESESRANFAVTGVAIHPRVPVEGDSPRVTVSVESLGPEAGGTQANLFFDGRRVDSQWVQFDQPGRREVAFRLPALRRGRHGGYVELLPDAMPADDRFHFVLDTGSRLDVLVVDGAPSSAPFSSGSDFLALALSPPGTVSARSPIAVKVVVPTDLDSMSSLERFVAVFLADVPSLSDGAKDRLDQYVRNGGLCVVLPGAHGTADEWKAESFPRLTLGPIRDAGEKRIRISWLSPQDPVTQLLSSEGLERLAVKSYLPIQAGAEQQVLMRLEGEDPFLVRYPYGRGRIYAFAVDAQVELSNLPLTPVFLPLMHRIVLGHAAEMGLGIAAPAGSSVRVPLVDGMSRVATPDGRILAMTPIADDPGYSVLDRTEVAGLYRLVGESVGPDPHEDAPVAAAIHTPAEESSLLRIKHETVQQLLHGLKVSVLRAENRIAEAELGGAVRASYGLAVFSLLCLTAAALLAWHIDRPVSAETRDQSGG